MNSELYGNEYTIPDKILNNINKVLINNPNDEGIKRAKYLLNNKRISYSNLKRLKNFFDHYSPTVNSEVQFQLSGGLEMKNWIDSILNSERKSVETSKEIRQDMSDNNVNKDLKINNDISRSIHEDVDSNNQNNILDNPNFKKWFSGSKVVDGSGKPLKVFHGTNKEFGEFERTSGQFGSGMYFSRNKDDANYYAILKGGEQNIMPVYLSIKNPFYYDIYNDKKSLPTRTNLIKKGYDGVIGKTSNGTEEIIAFYPNQIKSATGNNGNFSTTSNNVNENINNVDEICNPDTISDCAIAIIFNNDRKILLLKRSENIGWMNGKWALVGGSVEENETPLEAVKREIFEETKINISKIKEKICFDRNINKEYLFAAKFDGNDDDIVLNEEHSAYGFFNLNEIKLLDIVPNIISYVNIAIKDYN